jgi:hypothetical protein
MISAERQEELESIANEIFEALSCERYEPSERGAGWAPTDKGYENVIHILSRAKATMWDHESPAERRKAALAERKRQQKKAKKVAERLLSKDRTVHSTCIHCNKPIYRKPENIAWLAWNDDSICQVRLANKSRYLDHEATERTQ